MPTLGRSHLEVHLDEKIIPTVFQVVHSGFPISHDGILGKPFMITNEIIMNYQTNEVIIPND